MANIDTTIADLNGGASGGAYASCPGGICTMPDPLRGLTAGYNTSTNSPANDTWGSPSSLTSYIWESLEIGYRVASMRGPAR